MKLLVWPIRVISESSESGVVTPIRFQISNSKNGPAVVRVEKILNVYEEDLIGTKVRIFHCQSVIKG